MSPERPRHPVVHEECSARDAAETEYLAAVFEPLHFYGVPGTQYDLDEHGDRVERQTWSIWQVVAKRGTFSRPKMMPTIETPSDPILTKRLALEVVPHHWSQPDGAGDDPRGPPRIDVVRTFPEGEATWVDARSLASMEVLSHQIATWRSASALPDGCVELTDRVRAKPLMPLTDPRCPLLVLRHALDNEGWVPVQNHTTHTDANKGTKEYYGKEAMKLRPYYQVILSLDRSFRFCSRIPSTQPVKFYELGCAELKWLLIRAMLRTWRL